MSKRIYLAIDLGAESGRVIAGLWNGKTIAIEQIHRFPNRPVSLAGSLRWNITGLCSEILDGLAMAGKKYGSDVVSVGADTWGVDYVLLNKHDEMLGLPYCYRDSRTNGMMDRAFQRVPRADIFSITGLQFMQFNTLYQLLAMRESNPDLLTSADVLLLMPDFVHWVLCGSRVVEFTNGSTTQCMDALKRGWARDLLHRFGLPDDIFPQIVQPGTNLGKLRGSVAEQTGLVSAAVVAPATHDTASAVAAVPSSNTGTPDWIYISSGTWSLMGAEVQNAQLSPRALELNLTNEGGVDGSYRLLKNIMGLWLAQGCKRSFEAKGKTFSYDELARLAHEARPLRSLVNANDSRFLNPPDMVQAIQDFCRETNQPVPETEAQLIRCAYDSLALAYRATLTYVEELTGHAAKTIHIVGGGSQSEILNQLTAAACKRPVLAGPVEATAMGNLLIQARADGEVSSLEDIRKVVCASCELEQTEPGEAGPWDAAAERYAALCG